MFPVNQPSFHTSYYQFVTPTCNIATFHYKTWRTIVNIRFCSVDQIELYNLEPTHRSANIKLNKQLPFRVVDYHIVRSPLPGPHINHRFNIRLSFTCPGNRKLEYQELHQTICQSIFSLICIFRMGLNKTLIITIEHIKPFIKIR